MLELSTGFPVAAASSWIMPLASVLPKEKNGLFSNVFSLESRVLGSVSGSASDF